MSPPVVAAGRLVFPNLAIARASGTTNGLPLEQKIQIDLSALAPPGAVAEVGRLCVAKSWRSSAALLDLCMVMCEASLTRGVLVWISAANMECDDPDEARDLHLVFDRMGLVDHAVRVTLKGSERPAARSRFSFFRDGEERRRALAGAGKTRLPKVIALDAALGARYVGEPLWDAHFGMFAMPLYARVEDVRAAVERFTRTKRDRRPC